MPRIFISYRREDTQFAAGRLYDRLSQQFGKHSVFMDVAAIELGTDFAARIDAAVGRCDVLVALIGPKWLNAADAQGQRRLDHPDDLVRIEVLAGLTRGVRVIPALVDGATMPRPTDLPAPLEALSRRNAMTLDHSTFQDDVHRLTDAISGPAERARWVGPALWAAQLLLAAVFTFHGILRLRYGPDVLATEWGLSYAARQSPALLRFVGVAQIVASALLVMPPLVRRAPAAAGLAAAGLAVSMALGLVDHTVHAEFDLVPLSVLMGGLATFVAWGRLPRRWFG